MFSRRMNLSAAAGFCYRFGTGLKAGADLLVLLKSEAGYGPARQREAMRSVRERAANGEQLSQAMQREHPYFPPLLVSMIRVGEATGRIERTLLALSDHYRHRLQMRRRFLSSITWPAIQLFAALFILSLLIWLLGNLTTGTGDEMFDMLGFGMRGTMGVLKLWAYVGLFAVIIAGLLFAYSRNLGGVQNVVPLLHMIPVLGPALQTIMLSRFCWTLSLSLDAGLDPVRSISLALDSTDSDYYRAAEKQVRAAVERGASLSGALKATEMFPEDFLTRVEISEISGTDAESIDMLAQEYDEKAKRAVSVLSGIATGVIWLTVMGGLVFLIIRMAMNIFGGMYDATQF